mgnify:CR=1 FL=1
MTYEDAIICLKILKLYLKLDNVSAEKLQAEMCKKQTYDIAIEALEKQRKSNAHNKCYVVIQRDYATGGNISVYKDESDARRSVIEDVETVKKELLEDGHEPIANWDALRNPEVIVADSNIYFEWEIIETNIL